MTSSAAFKNVNTPEEFQTIVDRRRHDRMSAIDALPADVRQLVHEYGFNVVKAHLDLGVKKAKHIRHLVETTLNEFSPTRGAGSSQGIARAPGLAADRANRMDHPSTDSTRKP